MYAVTLEPLNSVFFMSEDPGQGPWTVESGIDLDFPSNYDLWPEGSPMPDQVVCISTSDPKHFKVFKFSRNVDPDEYRLTGKVFGGIYSRRSWERFKTILAAQLRIASIHDEDESGEPVVLERAPGGDS